MRQQADNKSIDILILAAGLGTRMKSGYAKVLHKLDGRPFIAHVCRTAQALAPRKIIVVIGHQGDEVMAAVNRDRKSTRLNSSHEWISRMPSSA